MFIGKIQGPVIVMIEKRSLTLVHQEQRKPVYAMLRRKPQKESTRTRANRLGKKKRPLS